MKILILLMGAFVLLSSCSTPESSSAAQALGGSSQALLYLNCRAVSQEEVEFEFSQPVTIKHLSFEPELKIASVENGSTVKVILDDIPEAGKMIVTDIIAEDEKRNTINVIVSFRSRNDRMPSLEINEICTEYANAAKGKKSEFVELKMKSDGSLGAMRLVINGNSNAAKETVYEFSPVNVKKDDYVMIYLRTFDEANKDEYTDNLLESGGETSSSAARDFYVQGTEKILHKTSFIYVLDQDDNVIDAVIICEKPENWWTKDYFAKAAEFLFNKDSWKSKDGDICRPSDAFISSGTTNTRTICRDESAQNTNSVQDWYITATSSATPGEKNNTKRYSN